MTATSRRGPVVVDTDVFSADIVPTSPLTAAYAPILAGRHVYISFQTEAELRYGALRRGWGPDRMRRLELRIRQAEIVHSGPELVRVCAQLRADCERIGHALAARQHNADRWIAATATRLGMPLVSNDAIFQGVPDLVLESVAPA